MKSLATELHSVETGVGSPMRLFVARPDSDVPAPCVLVFHEAFGLNDHIRDVTMRVAGLGYVAVAPELFHRTAPGFEGAYDDLAAAMPHMQALTAALLENDLNALHAWTKTDRQTQSEALAALGFCMGGKAAFLANGALPLQAAVSFYGSSIPSLLETYAARQAGPLLLIWAGQDRHIDAAARNGVAEALRAREKTFVQMEFSEADHGFFCDERASYHQAAAHEAWSMTAVFLKSRLARQP